MIQQPNVSALAPKSPYKKRTFKPAHIKYGGAFLAFFMMIGAIRVFLNYATIQSSIEHVIQERENIIRQEQYSALQAYVYSLPISKTFISHDNGILLPGEKIMREVTPKEAITLATQTATTGGELSGDILSGSDTVGISVLGTGEKHFLYELPAWKSWVVYFGQKME